MKKKSEFRSVRMWWASAQFGFAWSGGAFWTNGSPWMALLMGAVGYASLVWLMGITTSPEAVARALQMGGPDDSDIIDFEPGERCKRCNSLLAQQ